MIYAICGLTLCIVLLLIIRFRPLPAPQDGDLFALCRHWRNVSPLGHRLRFCGFWYFGKCVRMLNGKKRRREELLSFEKWLRDNDYIMQRALREVRKTKWHTLPAVDGAPRIIAIARYLVGHALAQDKNRLQQALASIQQSLPLYWQELCALKYALCFAALERTLQLSKDALQIQAAYRSRHLARPRGDKDAYLFYRYQNGYPKHNAEQISAAKRRFYQMLLNDEAKVKEDLSVLNLALKLNEEFFLSLSTVYGKIDAVDRDRMAIETKLAYLSRISYWAERQNVCEESVVNACNIIAKQAQQDFGVVLFDRSAVKTWLRSGRVRLHLSTMGIQRLFVATVLVATTVISAIPLAYARNLVVYASLPLVWIEMLFLVQNIAHRFVGRSRADFRMGYSEVPDQAPTIVVVANYIDSQETLQNSVAHIRALSHNSPKANITYCMLVDFPASNAPWNEKDETLLTKVKEYAEKDDIIYAVRDRVKEERYVAYERKRGAIMDLFALLCEGNDKAFRFLSRRPKTQRYAVLLDDDSQLLPGGVVDAVNSMLHPASKRYAIMTFGAVTNLFSTEGAFASRYRCEGTSGGYPVSGDYYWQHFGTAVFCGKAIVDIDTFYHSLKDRFPDRRILSHDVLEGAILSTGSTRRPVFEDAPNNFRSHALRLARWQRGDVLLLPYLARIGKNRWGERVYNQMQPIYRFLIFCNALSPLRDAAILLCAFLGVLTKTPVLLWAAVFVCAVPIVLDIVQLLPAFAYKRMRYVLRDMVRALLFGCERMLMLPYYALGASLFISTLLRSLFSNKSLLVWKPFFSTQKSKNVLRYVYLFVPSKIAIALLGILSFSPYFMLYAAIYCMWTFVYYVPWQKKEKPLAKEIQEQLRTLADETYRYFCQHSPGGISQDTVQIAPPDTAAPMSSPTDMGFGVLSHVCALLLGADEKACFAKIRQSLSAIDRLPKWKGHLYNWYSMEGKPLGDTVSTVDSANFVACMYVVGQVAKAYDKPSVAAYCAKLSSPDFAALYDPECAQLYIVYHPKQGKAKGHYDTLASEARLAYLLAVADGLSIRPYYGLSRDIVRCLGNTVLSWGGTAFEYLLPRIFVKPPVGSLLASSEYNCSVLQSKCGQDGIWGISESCCIGFNDQMRYRYQANGLDRLSLHPDCGEKAYSPYACALAAQYLPQQAAQALLRYRQVGMGGEFGLYDAFQDGKPLKAYMAHHQGMLLASLTNVLCQDALCRYFMRDERIASALLLVCESNPTCRASFRRVKRIPDAAYQSKHFAYDYPKRAAHALVCGDSYALFLSDGRQETYLHGNLIGGVAIGNAQHERYLAVRRKGESDCRQLYTIDGQNSRFEITGGSVLYRYRTLPIHEEIRLMPDGNGLLRDLCIENTSDEDVEYEVSVYESVSLCSRDAYISHRAFCDMFVGIEIQKGIAAWRRTQEGRNTNRTVWTVHGLQNLVFCGNRRQALARNGFGARFAYGDIGKRQGDVIYPCIAYRGECLVRAKSVHHIYTFCRMSTLAINDMYAQNQRSYQSRMMPSLGMAECLGQEAKLFDKYASQDTARKMASCLLDSFDCVVLSRIQASQPKVLSYTGQLRADLDSALCVRLLSHYFDIRLSTAPSNDPTAALCAQIAGSVCDNYIPFAPRIADFCTPIFVVSQQDKRSTVLYESGEGFFVTPSCYEIRAFDRQTALPYTNVVGNGKVGFVLTENGGGYFFGENSRQNKWTLWRNDIVQDTPTHWLFACYQKQYIRLNDARYCTCRHYADKTTYTTHIGDNTIVATYCIAGDHLQIGVDQSMQPIPIVLAFRPLLDWHENPYCFIKKKTARWVVIQNAVSKARLEFACDKGDFFCDWEGLQALLRSQSADLGRISVVGCLQTNKRSVFYLGEHIDKTASPYVLSGVAKIEGDLSLNLLMQGAWHQLVSSRIMARTSFYQCGGAIGYRDQLQDLMAYLYSDVSFVRQALLQFAAHQYAEGDVMHWWHPPKTGVRTKIRDDRLFLCYAVCKYVRVTGDESILIEETPFLVSDKLRDDETSRYETPSESRVQYSMMEHIKRAISSVLEYGKHDLLKVWGGDWNDGINEIGLKGKGESVWLSMFAYMVFADCVSLCPQWQDWLDLAMRRLKKGIAGSFVEDRFVAYYTDDGAVIGNGTGHCSLYLLPQAFACFCKAVDGRVAKVCVNTAKSLVDYDLGTISLFAPPFDSEDRVGYIASYPNGVRENGGQYTHAAIWYIKGLLALGEKEYAYELLQMINPVLRRHSGKETRIYQGEPYVLAADVYTNDGVAGQAGWTWYTGSASWMVCVILEDLYGVDIRGGKLYLKPNLPKALANSTLYLTWQNKRYVVRYCTGKQSKLVVGEKEVDMDYVDLRQARDNLHVVCQSKTE